MEDRFWFKCPTCEHGLWIFRNVDYEIRIVQCGKCGKFCDLGSGKPMPYQFSPISGLSQFGRAIQRAERTSQTRLLYPPPIPQEHPVTEVRLELPEESLSGIKSEINYIRNKITEKKGGNIAPF